MEQQLQQGSRYDFRIRDADGRGATDYRNLAFAGYGRWIPEVENQPGFAVVVSEDGGANGDPVCHHVWNLDRIIDATETTAPTVET